MVRHGAGAIFSPTIQGRPHPGAGGRSSGVTAVSARMGTLGAGQGRLEMQTYVYLSFGFCQPSALDGRLLDWCDYVVLSRLACLDEHTHGTIFCTRVVAQETSRNRAACRSLCRDVKVSPVYPEPLDGW